MNNLNLSASDLSIDDTPDDTELTLIHKFRQLDPREQTYFLQEINQSAMATQRCRQNDFDLAHRKEMENV